MSKIIGFLLSALMCIILILTLLITIIGSLWVLRVAIDWWLEIDYVKEIRRWCNERNNRTR